MDLFSSLNTPAGGREIFSVSDLTRQIKERLEKGIGAVWVEGEVSNFARPVSGHWYLTLKDAEAQIRVVVFRHVNQTLPFTIENGAKIVCYGSLTVYAPRGEYQLVATRIEPKGLGALQLAFEQLKKKLYAEGLFDPQHKKKLPLLPQRIGIVTSITGAAIRDMLHVLDRRYGTIQVVIVPVKVQGEGSAQEIAAALDLLNEYGKVDVIIVGRGGGSLEDLWAFNEEAVARAIYRSQIPVISAVGHEVDVTISDYVADVRAATPSAAAEIVIQSKEQLVEQVANLRKTLTSSIENTIDGVRERLDRLSQSYFFKQPRALIEQHVMTVDALVERLQARGRQCIADEKAHFGSICEKMETLNPLKVLARGYGVTVTDRGVAVKSIAQVSTGDEITTRVSDGSIQSRVVGVNR